LSDTRKPTARMHRESKSKDSSMKASVAFKRLKKVVKV
jgi:hypothetical protein